MQTVGLQTYKWENNFKSIVLLIMFPILLCGIGFLILLAINFVSVPQQTSNDRYYQVTTVVQEDPLTNTLNSLPSIFPFFVGLSALWFMIAWVFNKQIVSSLTNSTPLDRTSNPRIYNLIENLCISRGITTPQIYIIEDKAMNAFASGMSQKDSTICVTRGLIDNLTDAELEAVFAHELTHILNNDVRLMMIAIIFVGIIQTIAMIFVRVRFFGNDGGGGDDNNKGVLIYFLVQIVVFIIAFFFTLVVQAAISKRREYLADAGSSELLKTSQPLIDALSKISQNSVLTSPVNANIAQMFIENPIGKTQNFWTNLFASHPAIEDRIKALKFIDSI